jgi:hypothetical protein
LAAANGLWNSYAHHSLVDGELLAQGEVLQGQLAMAAEEDGEEPK